MKIETISSWRGSCTSKAGACCFGYKRSSLVCMNLMKIDLCRETAFVLKKRSKLGRFHYPVEVRRVL